MGLTTIDYVSDVCENIGKGDTEKETMLRSPFSTQKNTVTTTSCLTN